MATSFAPPVDQLLSRGDPDGFGEEWPNYLKLGFRAEHIPELIRMATDKALNRGDPATPEVWAPLHAWRALGQLRAEAAISPLLALLSELQGSDDYAHQEIPVVLGMIGPVALPAMEAYLADSSHDLYDRVALLEGFVTMAEEHPETRAECVGMLTRQLELSKKNAPALNGFILGALLDLGATEAAPVIERAFAEEAIDETIAGDWAEAQWELGLSDEPPQSVPYDGPVPWGLSPPGFPSDMRPPTDRKAKAKAKAKRKQAAKSRKRNRKRR
jgi:hypothetical protein